VDPFREVSFPGFGCLTVPRTIVHDRMADVSLFGALVGWTPSGRSLFQVLVAPRGSPRGNPSPKRNPAVWLANKPNPCGIQWLPDASRGPSGSQGLPEVPRSLQRLPTMESLCLAPQRGIPLCGSPTWNPFVWLANKESLCAACS
jgi:hypothetical protein